MSERPGRLAAACAAASLALALSACAVNRGYDAPPPPHDIGTAHQLQDLNAAYQKGDISKSEYEKRRQDLMGR